MIGLSPKNAEHCEHCFLTAAENNLICETASEDANTPREKNSGVIFVSVGTTSFDQLIDSFNAISLQNVLLGLGYRKIVFQIGRGRTVPLSCSSLQYEYYTFKDSLDEDLRCADLVVSHAGAGTCLEVCKADTRLLVVVNDSLMHNHQSELAEKLSRGGHCLYTVCDQLDTIFKSHAGALQAGALFSESFRRFRSDYYGNVATAIGEMFCT